MLDNGHAEFLSYSQSERLQTILPLLRKRKRGTGAGGQLLQPSESRFHARCVAHTSSAPYRLTSQRYHLQYEPEQKDMLKLVHFPWLREERLQISRLRGYICSLKKDFFFIAADQTTLTSTYKKSETSFRALVRLTIKEARWVQLLTPPKFRNRCSISWLKNRAVSGFSKAGFRVYKQKNSNISAITLFLWKTKRWQENNFLKCH